MKKPVIGIVPLVDEGRKSLWMLPGYMDGILQAGGVPVMLPLTEDQENIERLAETADGFLFTGGQDVSPELYGQEKLELCGECCGRRDRMEVPLLEKALQLDKPVLGICRGLQFINAVSGGTLYQDLPVQHPSETGHRQKAPYDIPSHEVDLTVGTPLAELMGKTKLLVNSCHHQAVRELGKMLKPMAVSEDGLVESVYMPDKKWVWAVQWHPEFMYLRDEDSRKIFRAFVEQCVADTEK